jgi:hypothetical protein
MHVVLSKRIENYENNILLKQHIVSEIRAAS